MTEIDADTLAELHALARSRPRSGRASLAKASAIRTLERLSREGRSTVPMPVGWHPHPGEWDKLDACDSVEVRERWFRGLYE